LVLVNDGELVLAAGTPEGLGVAIIAGTGSIAVGCAADGRPARAGGWGHLFGDEGSAYAAALAGLRLVAQRADGRRPPPEGGDALTEGLCRALGINGPAGLIAAVYGRGLDRTALASLAPAVVAAGDADPVVRSEILEPAGRELARMVLAVVRALDLTAIAPSLPLAMGGGFLLGAPTVAQVLLDELDRQGLSVSATPVSDPVSGALVLARKALATC
ncbi:MAG: N-acetylglucosamine kinase, partial [Isosphaeraceae bacterium]|nr:N-acetylglucosamine kinase [Isosphaeraceae bacterium]